MLKPGGRLLLLEHQRSPFAPLAWYQVTFDMPSRLRIKSFSQLPSFLGMEAKSPEAAATGIRRESLCASVVVASIKDEDSVAKFTSQEARGWPQRFHLAQDVTAGAVAATGKGCYWNQDVGALVSQAGLRVASKQDSLGGLITSLVAIKT